MCSEIDCFPEGITLISKIKWMYFVHYAQLCNARKFLKHILYSQNMKSYKVIKCKIIFKMKDRCVTE